MREVFLNYMKMLLNVARILFLLVAMISIGCSQQTQSKTHLPEPLGYVNDYEKIFTALERADLENFLSHGDKMTGIQIAVVSIDTSMVSRDSFDTYTLKLFNQWGVGDKQRNDGILIGLSKAYRKIRIQNGYGIAEKLSDAATKQIIDTVFVPRFKDGKYYEGVLEGVEVIMEKLQKPQQ
jgi:uncharacterized protein